MDSRNRDLMQDALDHASQGKPVFPCNMGKQPLTPHGFKDASTTPATIQQWWERHPDALIGIPTGAITGVFVLDVSGNVKMTRLGN